MTCRNDLCAVFLLALALAAAVPGNVSLADNNECVLSQSYRLRGGRRHAKLDAHRAFLLARIAEKEDIAMPELSAELAAATGTKADPASISRWLFRNGYRFKKHCWPANEIDPTSNRHATNGWLCGNRGCGLSHTG